MELIFTPSYSTLPLTHFQHERGQFSLTTAPLMRAANAANYTPLFYHLNWFLSSLPAGEQKKIFDLYAQAEELLRTTEDMATVNSDIRDIFADLLGILDAERIFNWFKPSDIYPWPVASELPRSYAAAVSPKYPEEMTYIYTEYQQLFALIIQLRACAPLWAAYLDKFGGNISTNYRDMILLSLLNGSTIDQTSGWTRLEMYISAWLGNKSENYTMGVIYGVSAEEYPRWFLCHVLIRKLMLQPLVSPQAGDASPFVIKHLSNFVKECMVKGPTQFETPRVKINSSRDDPSQADTDRSVYEANRVKESVARGERWTNQIYLEDYKRPLLALEPDIDLRQAAQIVKSFDNARYVPTPEQMLIAMWVMSPVISARSEDDLTRLNSVTVCAVTCAVLWHRGHKEVAVLMGSEQGAPVMRSGFSTASGTRLSSETYAKLSEIYPNSEKLKNTGNAYGPVRETCIGIVTTCQEFMWVPKLPEAILQQAVNLFPDGNTSALRVAQNMTTAIVDMVIDISQRKQTQTAVQKADEIAKQLGLPNMPVPWPVSVPRERPLNGDPIQSV